MNSELHLYGGVRFAESLHFGVCCSPSRGVHSRTEPSAYTISGRVLDADGNGVPGVAIGITGGATGTVTTDEDGRWSFSGAGGQVTVTPAHPDYEFDPPSPDDCGCVWFGGLCCKDASYQIPTFALCLPTPRSWWVSWAATLYRVHGSELRSGGAV